MPDTCANPLLLQWIKEWYEQAREQNSKGALIYKKAYESMKVCPMEFAHPSEAQQLHGLGPKLCARLTDKLKAHCIENGLPVPDQAPKSAKRKSNDDDHSPSKPAKKPRKPKPYVPAKRSGPFGLILALATLPEDATIGLTKQATIEEAQQHCDTSYTAPDIGKFYTAWNSMKGLVSKELVVERGRPSRYMLSEDGWLAAKRMQIASEETIESFLPSKQSAELRDSQDARSTGTRPGGTSSKDKAGSPKRKNAKDDYFDFTTLLSSPAKPTARYVPETILPPSPQAQSALEPPVESNTLMPTFDAVTLPPGSFSVHLILDNREVRTKDDRDYMYRELSNKGVKTVTRSLELGDALWVAKCNDPRLLGTHGEEGDEIVLDHIVERKRLDDLIGSIKDGRFHEQKFRLRKSGIPNVIYVIEEMVISQEKGDKWAEGVASAIASTQVVNGFFIKKTQRMDDTIRYLARMTEMLKERFESKPLRIIPSRVLTAKNYIPLLCHLEQTQPLESHHLTFATFSALSSKSDSLSLRDIFLKMLMCTRGVTGEKALEIQKRWQTPRALIEALEKTGDAKAKETMLSDNLSGLVGRKKIGRALSAKIAEVWGSTNNLTSG